VLFIARSLMRVHLDGLIDRRVDQLTRESTSIATMDE